MAEDSKAVVKPVKSEEQLRAEEMARGIEKSLIMLKDLEVPEKYKQRLAKAMAEREYHHTDVTARRLGASLSPTLRAFYAEVMGDAGYKTVEGEKIPDTAMQHEFLKEWQNAHAVETGQKTELQVKKKKDRQREAKVS